MIFVQKSSFYRAWQARIGKVALARRRPGSCTKRASIDWAAGLAPSESHQVSGVGSAVCDAVDHQGEGEVEPVVALAGGELGGVASGVGEGVGRQGGEPA